MLTVLVSLAPVTTQHALFNWVIDVKGSEANASTYYSAAHFRQGQYEGEVLYAYRECGDNLVRVSNAGGATIKSRPRIRRR